MNLDKLIADLGNKFSTRTQQETNLPLGFTTVKVVNNRIQLSCKTKDKTVRLNLEPTLTAAQIKVQCLAFLKKNENNLFDDKTTIVIAQQSLLEGIKEGQTGLRGVVDCKEFPKIDSLQTIEVVDIPYTTAKGDKGNFRTCR